MKIAKPTTFELNFYSAGSVTNHCQRQSGQDTLYTPTPEPTTQAIRNAEANLEKLVLRYAEDNILVTRVRLLIALFDSFKLFLVSGLHEGPLLHEDDSRPSDVKTCLLWKCWRLVGTLLRSFHHLGLQDCLP